MIKRLDKLISDNTTMSRSEARKVIAAGRVKVDGLVQKADDAKIDDTCADLSLDGLKIRLREFRYFMLDKPEDYVSATEDRFERTVMELLPEGVDIRNIAPVGRLDKDTTGLLILTNDGDYAHRVISPRSEVEKVYEVQTDKTPTEVAVRRFAEGVELRDGTKCLAAKLEVLGECSCRVTVTEGKYHQVKRMLAACGCKVVKLRRISIGMLQIDEKLGVGNCREMSFEEAEMVFKKKIYM